MNVKEAAKRLGLSEASVYALVQSNRLRCYRHTIRAEGRPRIVIDEHHIAQYLASVETPVTPPDRAESGAEAQPQKSGDRRAKDWTAEMQAALRRRP